MNMAASPTRPTGSGAREPQVYGGVCSSVGGAVKSFQGDPPPSPYRGFIFRTVECGGGVGVILIDVPLSLVGDTLTLPYTLSIKALEKQARQAPESGVTPTAAPLPASP